MFLDLFVAIVCMCAVSSLAVITYMELVGNKT